MLKKKAYIVVDVETVGYDQRIINLGLVVGDRKGNVLETKEWNIKEAIKYGDTVSDKFKFYLDKVKSIATEDNTVETFKDCYNGLIDTIKKYHNKGFEVELYSYNAFFDFGALMRNIRHYNLPVTDKQKKWLSDKWFCIYHYSAHLLMNRPTFKNFCKRHGHISDANNYRTNAEVCYQYITGNTDFIEEHTGLEDSKIEYDILIKCIKQCKAAPKSRKAGVWRIPQDK